MEKTNFDDLLERYLRDEVTEAERKKIDAWLEVMKTEDNRNLELSKDDEEKLFQHITSNIKSAGDVISIYPGRRKNSIFSSMWKVAASLLILAIAGIGLWLALGKDLPTELLTSTEIKKLILADGSIVWLKGDSKLVYYEKQEGAETYRYSELQGEALFEVAKDPTKPFVIQCNDVRIRVLGTSFNVRADDHFFELSVLTGKVNLSTVAGSKIIEASHHEKVVYDGQSEFVKTALAPDEQKSVVLETEYDMSFSDDTMEDVFEELEEKFDVVISAEDLALLDCRVTIDLTDKSLTNSLAMLSEVLHMRYAVAGKTVQLSGSGCR